MNLRATCFLVVLAFCISLVGCGAEELKKSDVSGSNSGETSANSDNSSNGEPGQCSDRVRNGSESDVDCGGDCDACTNGSSCGNNEDCASGFCSESGICEARPLAVGDVCSADGQCESGSCKDFGGISTCTEPCTDVCNGQNLACFRGECVPEAFCDTSDGANPQGPGCAGQCDDCATDATCSEQAGGDFACLCNDGFEGDGESCTDIDECSTGVEDCGENAFCVNTVGSFSCTCSDGYEGDGQTCIDIDECATNTDNCSVNGTCANLDGSFQCSCAAGFEGDGVVCTDIDECAAGTDNCSGDAVCMNNPGGFTCGCAPGYSGDGTECTDIDECAMGTDNCDANAECTNSEGSFSCVCAPGYSGSGTACADVNECAAGTDDCDANATCTNLPGSFDCMCDPGFVGNGTTCSDQNECSDGTAQCGANTECLNMSPGFACVCSDGFGGDPNAGCTNVDECADGTDMCDTNATCADTIGDYSCTCDSGFAGDGFSCADIDECAMGTDNCGANADCTNTPGSFTCACADGYQGDGFNCVFVGYTGDICSVAYPTGTDYFSASGNTTSSTVSDDYNHGSFDCPGNSRALGAGAPDEVYEFVPTQSVRYLVDISASFDAHVYVVTDCSDIDLGCVKAGTNYPFYVDLTAGTTYYVIVDGANAGDEGAYTVEIYEDTCTNANPCHFAATCDSTSSGVSCVCNPGYNGNGFTCTPNPPEPGEFVFSEIMQNPNYQTDADGEWFEFYNASGRWVNLDGCRVLSYDANVQSTEEFTISGSSDLPPGDYIAYATSSNLLASSDYVYNGAINLSNGSDWLELRCITSTGVEEQIDYVAWDDGATFPDPNGSAMNLDPGSLTAALNDSGANWCEATNSYAFTDRGTPSQSNTSCP